MSTENSCTEMKVENSLVIKPRLSLFKPNLTAGTTDIELKPSENKCLSKYCDKLLLERELWKDIYKDLKNSNKCLRKELEDNVNGEIHFNILNDEEMEYEKSKPNFYDFMKQVNDLQNHTQIVEEEYNKLRRQKRLELRNLQLKIVLIEQECFEHDNHFIS